MHAHGLENHCCDSLSCSATTQLAYRFPGLAVNKACDWMFGGRDGICGVYAVVGFSIQNDLSDPSPLLNVSDAASVMGLV